MVKAKKIKNDETEEEGAENNILNAVQRTLQNLEYSQLSENTNNFKEFSENFISSTKITRGINEVINNRSIKDGYLKLIIYT